MIRPARDTAISSFGLRNTNRTQTWSNWVGKHQLWVKRTKHGIKAAHTLPGWIPSRGGATRLHQCRYRSGRVPFWTVLGCFGPLLGPGRSGPDSSHPGLQTPDGGGKRAFRSERGPRRPLWGGSRGPSRGLQSPNGKPHSFGTLVLVAACSPDAHYPTALLG